MKKLEKIQNQRLKLLVSKRKFKNVLVVLGGKSGERAVSLASGKACIKALRNMNYNVLTFDPQKKNFNLINKKNVDVIFNALHGKGGEDGVAQSYFEYLNIPYTHSGVVSSFNAMNKVISKEIFIQNRINTPKFFSINKKDYNWYSCWVPRNTFHKFVFKSNNRQFFELKKILFDIFKIIKK